MRLKDKKFVYIIAAVIVVALLIRFFPKKPILDGYSFSQSIFAKDNRLLRLTLAKDEQYRLFVPLSSMPKTLQKGAIYYEDRYFYFHFGINPISLIKAFWTTIVKKEKPIGASTITMQTAKIVYGINSSKISGKIKQIFAALWLEMRYSKKDILEAYLNIAPYGYNIEGAGAASLIYFDKRADKLNLVESLTLCIIPQNPNFRRFSDNQKKESRLARKRLFEFWAKRNPKDLDIAPFFDLDIPIKKPSQLPFLAPHFTQRVISQNKSGVIYTNLDLDLQNLLERQIKNYIAKNSSIGIDNASAILVNYKTMDIAAYVGSADFFDKSIDGQVNGVAAYRSPGSLLKPFIYALALDKGLIHPMSLLKDAPRRYGIYAPENSDRDFMGPIFAANALIQSRNIAAIDLLFKVGADDFLNLLNCAGVRNLKSADFYGASLAIGGFEISMEKIAMLYAMLANKGFLQWLKFDNSAPSQSLAVLSPEAAILALKMLKDNKRPTEEIKAAVKNNNYEVYWKTGTSYSFRDIWCGGVFGDFVLIVWIGHFNNEENQNFLARSAAAPLFFEISQSIAQIDKSIIGSQVDAQGLNIIQTQVCAVSGQLPTQYCSKTIETSFIPSKSPIALCDIHRPVYIDKKSGHRMSYYDPHSMNMQVFEFWSSDILEIYKLAGINIKQPPSYAPGAEISKTSTYGAPPQIVLPTENAAYIIRSVEKIPFKANTDADAKTVFWFINNKFIGRSKSGETIFTEIPAGNWTINAADDLGRTKTIELKVKNNDK
ncbi:MAG: penicillin-binding protein 1C [Elusimicrobiota bacterium]|jgi:penicillin-binding protein 1C|nr:penicillin-binding protein 1C [Elusimicrobiota bacterium]